MSDAADTTIEMQDADLVHSAVEAIRAQWGRTCEYALILGSGLGKISQAIDSEVSLDYSQIPGFAASTAVGHRGRLICGHWHGHSIVVMEGRCHLYEGHRRSLVTRPIRVMQQLGVRTLIVTCASGGLNPIYKTGDVLAIEECLDLTNMRRWLTHEKAHIREAQSPQLFGSAVSDEAILERALSAARRINCQAHRGTYIAVTGPNYETRSEYQMLRGFGGDAVGMSTAPELAEAHRLGINTLGMSIITNCCQPTDLSPTSGQQVVDVAEVSAQKLSQILSDLIQSA